ncbi:Glycosyltransferase involved in cell wall bisynthesis [Abditibacterium utsteinense]|uniref:Glycosyltransferase involved in cell wall bisynthesis n=1 Tax=Abditibacterium utsteinense TaxID=1960156 RepID=A0A2S8SWQ3_9BACT|nr:glycosyltransferase family 4 protein [Abditibacterium utsteinense]PQV65204.1 Glycosyltransferase involved in cell wall bisynthesis [Abditibacterium utsteinense]
MNILMLQDAVFADKPGGSRVVSRQLARGLAERGHQITFLVARQAPGTPDDEKTGAIRIVRYSGAGQAAAFVREGRQSAARLWQEAPFDIVHTQFAYAAHGPAQAFPRDAIHIRSFYGPWDAEGYVEDSARLAALKTPLSRVKMSLQRAIKRRVRHQTEAQSLARSRAVIVLSEHSRREALSFGTSPERIHLVHGGVDTQRFVPPAGGREAARGALDVPQNGPLLFCVRRLAPRMGLDNLLLAMRAVVKRHPDATLLLGGSGPERARLEQLIVSLELTKNVRLLGFIPENQLVSYYAAADLFVLPTTALEGFGLVTVEALSCGTPVLGTPIGATPEILGKLDKRLLAPSASADGIAQGICNFLENSWRSDLTSDRLHDFVLQNYNWQHHVDAVETLYQALLAAK